MILNSNCATKIAESQRTWKRNHLFLQKREPRNLRVLKLLTKSAKSAKSASLSKLREKFAAKSASFSKLAKKLGENPRAKSTRWKQPPTKLVHRRLSYKLAATYSPTLSCSTIGAHGLNCSVRNGKRCAPWL